MMLRFDLFLTRSGPTKVADSLDSTADVQDLHRRSSNQIIRATALTAPVHRFDQTITFIDANGAT
jgi:hypothetical protein